MKEISVYIRDIAASMERQADFLQNVVNTWKSPKVRQDVEQFIKIFTPYIDNIKKMGERFVELREIIKSISEGTEGRVMLTPQMELKPAQQK